MGFPGRLRKPLARQIPSGGDQLLGQHWRLCRKTQLVHDLVVRLQQRSQSRQNQGFNLMSWQSWRSTVCALCVVFRRLTNVVAIPPAVLYRMGGSEVVAVGGQIGRAAGGGRAA